MTRIPIDNTSPSSINTASINLTHLLDRLDNTLNSFADIKPLLRSPYHRARVAANIEYARTLLLELERACGAGVSSSTSSPLPAPTTTSPPISSSSPSSARRVHTDLAAQRQKLKELKSRFEEVNERAAVEGEILDDTDSDGDEEVIVPTPEESDGGEAGEDRQEEVVEEETRQEHAERETDTGLRSRRSPAATATPTATADMATATATTTGTSHATASSAPTQQPPLPLQTAKAELFHRPRPRPRRPSLSSRSPSPPPLDAETQTHLAHDRAEQETLTTNLLSLASQLKDATHTFASSLEGEKGILGRAVEGLDRNIAGMEKVGGRMGTVRRMAEGKGWWERMMMYAMIFGLWVVVILLVFVAPKLRF